MLFSKTVFKADGICKGRPGSLNQNNSKNLHSNTGFTLIELMIVIAIIAILLSLALPVYSNYTIRAKIAEGLGVAAAAKTATTATCQEDPTMQDLNNYKAGYTLSDVIDTAYIDTISISEDCDEPIITITTQNTGAEGFDPVIILTGSIQPDTGRSTWICSSSNTPVYLLPQTCRS